MVAMCGSFSAFIIPSQRLRQACQNPSLERVTQNASRWDLNSWELPKNNMVVLRILTAFDKACGDSFLLAEVRACRRERCDADSATLLQPWLTILSNCMIPWCHEIGMRVALASPPSSSSR